MQVEVKRLSVAFIELMQRVEGETQLVIKLTRSALINADLNQLIENDLIKISFKCDLYLW